MHILNNSVVFFSIESAEPNVEKNDEYSCIDSLINSIIIYCLAFFVLDIVLDPSETMII